MTCSHMHPSHFEDIEGSLMETCLACDFHVFWLQQAYWEWVSESHMPLLSRRALIKAFWPLININAKQARVWGLPLFFLIPDGSHHKVSQGRAPPNELALQAIVCWRIFCWSGLNKAFLCECSTDVDNLEALKRPKRPFVLARLQRACSQTCQILRSFLDTFCLGQIQCAEFSIQNFQCEAIIPKAKGLWTLNFAT